MLSVLDCIVTISFGVYLVLWLFELVLQCVGVLVMCVLVFTVLKLHFPLLTFQTLSVT